MGADHLGFTLSCAALRDRVLIPKFYDPDLATAVAAASTDFDLPELGELLEHGDAGSHLGNWMPREHYGGGTVPYVRTSDISHWRIRPDYKKGLSQAIFDAVGPAQDIRADDLLMVAHGTYLVGTLAIVAEDDLPLVLQDHVFRLRVRVESEVGPFLLLAALSTAFVRRQVRARQFSADIIDKLGNRHLGLRVPLPRDPARRAALALRVETVIREQSAVRQEIRALNHTSLGMAAPRAATRHGFTVQRAKLTKRILIPRYYDPTLDVALRDAEAESGAPWVPLRELISAHLLDIGAGVEVGKMAYGTGSIPFVRTSDLIEWEIKREPRQCVSDTIAAAYSPKGALATGDVVVVRDGTYLVGSSALVTPEDLPALFCGGLLRMRSRDHALLSPHTLLASLNLPLVRQQMRARQFTRDVIDTLGNRLGEVRIPDPRASKSATVRARAQALMARKAAIKTEIGALVDALEPAVPQTLAGRPGWSMR